MSAGDKKGPFLYDLPPVVFWEFCRVMDALSDLEWTRFGELEPELTVVNMELLGGGLRRLRACLSVTVCQRPQTLLDRTTRSEPIDRTVPGWRQV